jgi:hypothetical protein
VLHPWIPRRGRRRGRRSLHREDALGGSVPGADDDPCDREDRLGGSVPGADDDPCDREDRLGGSVPGADDDPCDREDRLGGSVPGADADPCDREDALDDPLDSVLPFAAKLYEPPAPISATVTRAASGRSFLLMFHSFVW